MSSAPSPRLPVGARLGRCTVVAFLGREALGERYAVFYGSTNHLLDVIVPPAGADTPTLEDYREYLRRLEPVARHPALAHGFGAGVDVWTAPTPAAEPASAATPADAGTAAPLAPLPWMRTEHVAGAPQWTLRTRFDDDALRAQTLPFAEGGPKEDNGDPPDVPDLERFFSCVSGAPEPTETARLLGDVLAALSTLHRARIPGNAPRAADVALDRTPHSSQPVARLLRYGVGAWEEGTAAADLAAFAALLRRASDLCGEGHGAAFAREAAAFADRLEVREFPTAAEALAEWPAALARAGIEGMAPSHAPAASRGGHAPSSSGRSTSSGSHGSSSRGRHHRHRSRSGLSSDSEAARRVRAGFGAAFFLLALAAIGFGVYRYLAWTDERGRERFVEANLADLPVVSVIPVERPEETESSPAGRAFRLDPVSLGEAALAGDRFARARLALDALFAEGGPTERTLSEADVAFGDVLPDLLDALPSDAAAAYLRGVGALLALGRPSEPLVACRELDASGKAGFLPAALLLGDWFASQAPIPPGALPRSAVHSGRSVRTARDLAALEAWRLAGGTPEEPTDLHVQAADRISWILRRLPKDETAAVVRWKPWLEGAARAGHIPSMALLAVSGPFAPASPAASLDWLRAVNRAPRASDAIKGWAQVRMAARFARGIGAPASESSARIWYERAAKLGNPVAMRRWADYLESGQGDPNGLSNPDAAAEWRARIETAAPEPDFAPALLPVVRPTFSPSPAGAETPAGSAGSSPAARSATATPEEEL